MVEILSDLDVSHLKTTDLLKLFSGIMEELRQRDVCRSSNNPVADYSEFLVAKALELNLARNSSLGYDATDSLTGLRYQIKGRRITHHNNSRQLSVIRKLNENHFDYLAGVLFNEDFSIYRACLIPHEVVLNLASFRRYVNGFIMYLRDSVWDIEGVSDITSQLKEL